MIAASCNELRHQEIFWADFNKVTQVDISLEGQEYGLVSKDKVTQVDISLEGQEYALVPKEEGKETVCFYGEEGISVDGFWTAHAAGKDFRVSSATYRWRAWAALRRRGASGSPA